jgi:hypothetical protein
MHNFRAIGTKILFGMALIALPLSAPAAPWPGPPDRQLTAVRFPAVLVERLTQ